MSGSFKPITPMAFAAAVALCGSIAVARAQSAPEAASQEGEGLVRLETFVVTGSYIPFASTQTALPVTVADEQMIADTGVATNVLEVLRKIAPQFSGSRNVGNGNANVSMGSTGGGSMISFRNTQTLVLVNGRRMAYAPALASGGFQFVDVNLIPMSAIERIEVLQDGASATYGTDAIGGVVNIILKSDFEGFEANARYSVSPAKGRYSERAFSIVGGAGSGRTSITVSAEYADSDPLQQNKREFSNPTYGTPTFGGVVNTRPSNSLPQYYILNPAINAPPAGHTPLATLVADGVYIPVNFFNLLNGLGNERQYAFNLADYTKLLIDNERRSATLNLEHSVNERLTLFGDIIYARTRTFSELNAQPLVASLPPTHSSNPTTQPMGIRNRFVAYPRLFYYDSTSIRGIAGARGTFADGFSWEAAVARNVVTQDYINKNLVDSTLRTAAVANGLINLAAREQEPGAIEAAGLFGTAWGKAVSALVTADARVTGRMFELPAGPVGFAIGTEYREESLDQSSDANSQTATFNWDQGIALNPFRRSRTVWSSFAELRVPLIGEGQRVPAVRSLELSAALRHERYSDPNNPTVPKFSLAWNPLREALLLRATYSESFAAPTLFDLFGPSSSENASIIQFTQLGGGQVVREFHTRYGSNSDLLPSRSKNLSFGMVWSPGALKGLSISADWFDIEQSDLVSSFDIRTIVQHVELNGPDSPYARFVKVGSFDGAAITAPGQLSSEMNGNTYVTGSLVNIANQTLKGVDVRAEYYRGTVAHGRIEASVSVGTYKTYSYHSLAGIAPVETVGLATPFNGTLPRWQSYASLSWSRGRWRANLGWQHIPGVTDPLGDGSERKPFEIRSYDSVDFSVACTFEPSRKWMEHLVLRAGANNVFDRQPPFGGGTFTQANTDTGTYNPIGRLLFVEAKYKF